LTNKKGWCIVLPDILLYKEGIVALRRAKRAEAPAQTPKQSISKTVSRDIETNIGPNCHIQGTIQSDGNMRIEGVFQGELDTAGNLVIAESAKIIAQVVANNVSVAGAVKGNISANRIEILETGRVWGDLTVNSLLLNEGAYLRGQTMMHADLEPPMIESPKSAQTPPPPPPPVRKSTTPSGAMMGEIVDIEPE
jgi:cytoskeletal protein CcmA (bactofilin family)